ncbi:MAG: MBL fold metallo-hydrolase [Mycoplasmoidaceae bacterium]|nr:MAG: MBL fold metallo-hydrolase [Mycoplasmoidaceae bacterium]
MKKIKFIFLTPIIILICFSVSCSKKQNDLYINNDIPPISNENSELKFHIIDVGQGSASLVELPNERLVLIDSGNDQTKFKNYIINFFNSNQQYNNTFDYFITSHPDSDHIASAKWIYDNYQVNHSYLPSISISSEMNLVDIENTKPLEVKDTVGYRNLFHSAISEKNSIWEYTDESDINDLFNSEDKNLEIKIYTDHIKYSDSNNYSPIITFTYNNKTILISSDAEKEKEINMASIIPQLEVDAYIMGHHGSYTSSGYELLEKIKPSHAFYSSYDPNGTKYGHPRIESLKRVDEYVNSGAIYGTEFNGNMHLMIDGSNFAINNGDSYIKTISGWTAKNGTRENI